MSTCNEVDDLCPLVRVRSMRMGFVIQRWKVRNPPPYTEVEPKYIEVAVRGTPVYFRENLARKCEDSNENLSYGDSNENLKTCKLRGLQ